MSLAEQIEIIKELLEATRELNGEYQTGWDEYIEAGEKLLKQLNDQMEWLKSKEL